MSALKAYQPLPHTNHAQTAVANTLPTSELARPISHMQSSSTLAAPALGEFGLSLLFPLRGNEALIDAAARVADTMKGIEPRAQRGVQTQFERVAATFNAGHDAHRDAMDPTVPFTLREFAATAAKEQRLMLGTKQQEFQTWSRHAAKNGAFLHSQCRTLDGAVAQIVEEAHHLEFTTSRAHDHALIALIERLPALTPSSFTGNQIINGRIAADALPGNVRTAVLNLMTTSSEAEIRQCCAQIRQAREPSAALNDALLWCALSAPSSIYALKLLSEQPSHRAHLTSALQAVADYSYTNAAFRQTAGLAAQRTQHAVSTRKAA